MAVATNPSFTLPKADYTELQKAHKASGLDESATQRLLEFMIQSRTFESRILALYKQGKMTGGVYSGIGNEGIAVGSAFALEKDDVLCPLHRDIGAHFVKGQTIDNMMLQLLGRRDGPCHGKDNGSHQGDRALNIIGMISPLGAMIPVAAGAALQFRIKNKRGVALVYAGDGTTSLGEFHEGVNFAAVRKLPMICIIENNQFAYSTPTSFQYACEKLSDRAIGYGMPGITLDGNNVFQVYHHVNQAVKRARDNQGPTLIEAITMRMRGHSEADRHEYVPSKMLEAWEKKDPLYRAQTYCVKEGIVDHSWIDSTHETWFKRASDAADEALAAPLPDPSTVAEGVYATSW